MLEKFKRFFRSTNSITHNDVHYRHDENLWKQIDNLNGIEKDLIKKLIDHIDITGEDIMVHRPQMVCVAASDPVKIIWDQIADTSYSCYPVFEENWDQIIGFVALRDLAKLMVTNPSSQINTIIKPILFIPASIPVIDILMKMRHAKASIAIMIDEHGGTDGLLSITDIIYKVFGEESEPDVLFDEELYFERLDAQTIIVEGQYPLQDLIEETGLELTPEEEAEELDTVNGFIQFLIGRVPDRSEIIKHQDNFEFEILESSPRAVLKVKVTQSIP